MEIEKFNKGRLLYINSHESLSLNLNVNIFKTRSSSNLGRRLNCSSIDTNISSSSETMKSSINIENLGFLDTNEIYDNFSNEFDEEEKIKYKYKILYNILLQRKKSALKISNFIKEKINIIKFRKKILIEKIIEKKINLIITLQKNIRGYLVKKSIQNILNCEYVFFFILSENLLNKISINNNNNNNIKKKQNEVECKIFNRQFQNKKFSFKYCRILNYYYLPLINFRVLKRKYRLNFIVNGETIIDSRYQVDTDNKGHFYNLIMKNMIFRFKKNKNEIIEFQEKKYWEKIFEIKKKIKKTNSYDSLSISNSNISNDNNNYPIYESEMSSKSNLKSILKNPIRKVESFRKKSNNKIRTVSFNSKIIYSY